MNPRITLVGTLLSAVLASTALRAADPSYHFIKEIPVGGSAQWDYLTIEPESHFVPALSYPEPALDSFAENLLIR